MAIIAGKTDTDLKMDVLAELGFEPSVNITDIGVLVKDGVVTLHGQAASYGEKQNAVRAVKRVAGVAAIADDIEVSLPEFGHHSDSDIAAAAANRINWSTLIPPGAVMVTVSGGHLTLAGEVEWGYQKHAAENAILHLAGVHGISNQIAIQPTRTVGEIGTNITMAIKRNAMLDAKDIHVQIAGSGVVLTGKVKSHAEWEEAERVAWAAAGVLSVDNQLNVEWFWDLAD